MDITLITAFLDIGRDNWSHWKRTTQEYINAFKVYYQLDYRMIIFMDKRYINEIKTDDPKKTIIPIDEEWLEKNSWVWRQLPIETEIMKSPNYVSLIHHRITCPETHNPKYTLINHAKIDFVCYALEKAMVTTPFVAWSDFGYFGNKSAEYIPKNLLDSKKFDIARINLCSNGDFGIQDRNPHYTLQVAPEVINGYFFFGPVSLMKKYQELYHSQMVEFQNMKLADDDQHLTLRCVFKNPEMFKVWRFNRWHWALVYFQQ